MKIVTYNIQFSRGKDDRYDLQRIADTVSTADIIALQEVERFWPRSGMQDQPALLSALLPQYYWIYAPVFDVYAGGSPIQNKRRQFGNMLLSKYPVLSSRFVVLPKHHYPEEFNMYQGAQECVIETPVGVLSLWNVHLGYLDSEERLEQLVYLMGVVTRLSKELGAWSGPGDLQGNDWSCGMVSPPDIDHIIWCGDFNSEPDSPEYQFILASDFEDAAMRCDAMSDDFTHMSLDTDPPLRRRLDYCFIQKGLSDRVSNYRVDREAIGSDHQPVWVEFSTN